MRYLGGTLLSFKVTKSDMQQLEIGILRSGTRLLDLCGSRDAVKHYGDLTKEKSVIPSSKSRKIRELTKRCIAGPRTSPHDELAIIFPKALVKC